ncbi:MAG: 16S rRNA (guanine(966)-N(2))-methyltransferase RsmD [Gammaproteobacteria bacterium]|nr:MAG: 16S rRNA (guanine(966)-N(2))-methyltransferase RsmD [Gammaproteobacteria bacterium]
MLKNQVTIIAGKHKRTKITFGDFDGLRPTAAKTRETLFSWLQHDITDSVCLDLFAGSGSLGFEATSRGCKKLIMVEKNYQICQQLKKNSNKISGDIEIINKSAEKFATHTTQIFDIVFFDPPFKSELYQKLNWFLEHIPLSHNGKVYVEIPVDRELELNNNWIISRKKIYSMVKFYLLTKKHNDE